MTKAIIAWCIKNRFLVVVLTLLVAAGGFWAMLTLPIDAIPDLSDAQVIVYSQWMGRDPETIEDQVTYPLTSKMLAVPGTRAVRGYSFFGFSLVYVIFKDGTDPYWARSRVLEYLSDLQAKLPQGVSTSIGPDATGVGWVYEYTVESGPYCPKHPQGLYAPIGRNGPYYESPGEGRTLRRFLPRIGRCPVDGTKLVEPQLDLGDLRALQDWYLRYPLTAVEGVSEVAAVGGFERQFQVVVDPNRLLTYNIPLKKVLAAIRESNNDVGGRLLEISETEFMIRGRGYVKKVEDLERSVIAVSDKGIPILLRDVATVVIGPDLRRGVAEKDGRGQVVAGIVIMRYGENALTTIDRVKAKLEELKKGLPPGVDIRPAYDRSALIHRSIATLRDQLIEEMIIVALVCIVFLWHARSALVAAVTLPLGILVSFLVMNALGINANIMSLGGIAIAIGAMVDAAVVLVENAHKQLEASPGEDRWTVIIRACQEVGPALFFSLLIITVSFLPVFALQAQAGRLFKPLAFTKTFAMAASSLLAITLIPVAIAFFVSRSPFPDRWSAGRRWRFSLTIVLIPVVAANILALLFDWEWFLQYRILLSLGWIVLMGVMVLPQRIRREEDNPVTKFLVWIYMPVLRFALRRPVFTIALAILVLAVTLVPAAKIGSEFMPPLNEGDILYMPTSIPGLSITEAQRTLQIQDRLFKTFPEVETVLGKIGRAETPTDPAPLTMVETTVTLKPTERWPKRWLVEGQIRDRVRPAFESLGDVPERYAAQAAEELEKMIRSELHPKIRHALIAGISARTIEQDLPAQVSAAIRGHAAATYEGKALQHRKDQAKARIEADLKSRPLGAIASTVKADKLEVDLGPVRARIEGWWPKAGDYVKKIREKLLKGWKRAEDRKRFRAELTDSVRRSLAMGLPEYLAKIELIKSGVDAEKVRQRVASVTRPDDLRPVRLRRIRDINELMYEDMDPEFQFPGLTNAWTMPIKTRIDMLATGIKTPIGIKIFGPDLRRLERLAIQVEEVVKRDPGTLSAIAERVFGGNYLNVEIDRDAIKRHGLTVDDVQKVIETAIGGMNITQTVEGLYRFKINARYPREMRNDPVRLKRVLVPTPRKEQIPLGQLAKIEITDGPPAIKSENAMRQAIVYVDLKKDQDVGGYVDRVRKLVDREVKLPPGYFMSWSGQYEYMQEVARRMKLIVPVTLIIIFLLLYMNMRNIGETVITMVTLPFALVGGVWTMYLLGYNSSVATTIGFIALAGLAAETAVVMHVYLDISYRKRKRSEEGLSHAELNEAIEEGAVLRVRPKMMTVMTTILALLPIMWAVGAGAGPMKRMAAPMIGGLITSTIHTLVLIPVYYMLYKKFEQWRETRRRAEEAKEPIAHPATPE